MAKVKGLEQHWRNQISLTQLVIDSYFCSWESRLSLWNTPKSRMKHQLSLCVYWGKHELNYVPYYKVCMHSKACNERLIHDRLVRQVSPTDTKYETIEHYRTGWKHYDHNNLSKTFNSSVLLVIQTAVYIGHKSLSFSCNVWLCSFLTIFTSAIIDKFAVECDPIMMGIENKMCLK